MIVGPPRRSIDDTEEKNLKWWLGQIEGVDLVYAVTSFEAKRWTGIADQDIRQGIYDNHLRAYTEGKVVAILNRKPVIETLEILGNAAMSQFYKLPKKLHQVLYCVHCGASDVAGPQGSHTCEGVKDSMEEAGRSAERARYEMDEDDDLDQKAPRTLKRMKRSRDPKLGILIFKLVFAHQLFDYTELLDMSGIDTTALDSQGLIWLDPTVYLEAAAERAPGSVFS